jgi:hypothetical protein
MPRLAPVGEPAGTRVMVTGATSLPGAAVDEIRDGLG